MRVYLPNGIKTTLENNDIISIRQGKDELLSVARAFRKKEPLLIGAGFERRYEYRVFLDENKEHWTPDYIKEKLKITGKNLKPTSSSNMTRNFTIIDE